MQIDLLFTVSVFNNYIRTTLLPTAEQMRSQCYVQKKSWLKTFNDIYIYIYICIYIYIYFLECMPKWFLQIKVSSKKGKIDGFGEALLRET